MFLWVNELCCFSVVEYRYMFCFVCVYIVFISVKLGVVCRCNMDLCPQLEQWSLQWPLSSNPKTAPVTSIHVQNVFTTLILQATDPELVSSERICQSRIVGSSTLISSELLDARRINRHKKLLEPSSECASELIPVCTLDGQITKVTDTWWRITSRQ